MSGRETGARIKVVGGAVGPQEGDQSSAWWVEEAVEGFLREVAFSGPRGMCRRPLDRKGGGREMNLRQRA